jgi:hypothetical protein
MPNLTALVPTTTAALDSGHRATASKLCATCARTSWRSGRTWGTCRTSR